MLSCCSVAALVLLSTCWQRHELLVAASRFSLSPESLFRRNESAIQDYSLQHRRRSWHHQEPSVPSNNPAAAPALLEEVQHQGQIERRDDVRLARGDESDDFLGSLQKHPDHSVILLWGVFFGICVLKVVGQSGAETAAVEVRQRRDSLHVAYGTAVEDIQGMLVNMSDATSELAMWNFEDKRRHFIKYLTDVQQSPSKYFKQSDAMTIAFISLVRMELKVFEQCSEDPTTTPYRPVEEKHLKSHVAIPEIAGAVANCLEQHDFSALMSGPKLQQDEDNAVIETSRGTWLKLGCFGCGRRDRRKHDKAKEGEPTSEDSQLFVEYLVGCVSVTIWSNMHALLFSTSLFGFVVLAVETVTQNWLFVVLIGAAEVFLLATLWKIDEIDEYALLQSEVEHLELARMELGTSHKDLVDQYIKRKKVLTLWEHRTLPCLELLDALEEQLMACPMEQKLALITVMRRAWDDLQEALGKLEYWTEEFFDSLILQIIASRVKSTTKFILRCKSVDSLMTEMPLRLERTVGFLIVRICAAQDLHEKGLDKLTHKTCPYVKLSVYDENGHLGRRPEKSSPRHRSGLDVPDDPSGEPEVRCTEAVEHTTDPHWEDEEFFIPIKWNWRHLRMEVFSDGADSSYGYVSVDFRALTPGRFYRRHERLISANKGTAKTSELVYEVYFASKACHLEHIDEHVEDSAAQALIRRTTTGNGPEPEGRTMQRLSAWLASDTDGSPF